MVDMLLALLLLPVLVGGFATNEVGPGATDFCPPDRNLCDFLWIMENRQTMMWYDGVLAHPVVQRKGKFWARFSCKDTVKDVKLTTAQLKQVITADGGYKYIQTINSTFPGPSIVAYEGQEIVINVTNRFWQQGIGIHWHGIKQQNTNWMDGVPGVTQCAINPQETFTYRFIAEPVGTHWYHSHMGLQRDDGVFGALIVLPNQNKPSTNQGESDPEFDKEFIMMVNDWYPISSNLAVTSFMNDLKQYMYDLWDKPSGQCFGGSEKAPNGVSAATFRFNSALINGKGYLYDSNGKPTVDVPLETFIVDRNKRYKFRVINAASAYAFKISIDGHPLTMIASDGHQIEPVKADSFIINAGERFDFYITANKKADNYWIRAETIEITTHFTMAVLRYNGAKEVNPKTSPTCMRSSCIVVNCPFKSFIRGPFVGSTCLNFEDLTSREPSTLRRSKQFEEHFISFEKTTSIFNRQFDTANGIMFMLPSTPPAVIGRAMYDHPCGKECRDRECQCTNQININLGSTVQIVLVANTTHPIHLHGHFFDVIKIGYPPEGHDNVTFKSLRSNPDYTCNNALCNKAFWTDPTWNNDNVPGTNLVNPPKKDTITIPAFGYVVLRFKADNPGWWLMHCHIETHMIQGMAVIFQSGKNKDMKKPPQKFPKCGTFKLSQKDFKLAMNGKKKKQ